MKRYLGRSAWGVLLVLLTLFFAGHAATAQTIAFGEPTTLDAETTNNTSAADTFTTSINNNVQPGNVSKVSLHSFLPDGSPTKIYSHFMGWWGGRDHIDIGYQSADPAQVGRQLDDMVSRGVDGLIVEWYGPGTTHKSSTARNTDAAAQLVMAGAEARGNFEFSIMIDQVALHTCVDPCDPTDELIRELTYINDTYMQSPAYTRIDGRPLVTLFGVDTRYNIDWSRVSASVPGNPLLMFQDGRGKLHSRSVSSFGWVHIVTGNPRDWQSDYLHWFYRLGQGDANAHMMAPVYKGFNDSMASWSQNRVLSQDCGRTWLRTWEALKANQDPLKPVDSIQLVTWNDYEEGTELESGIDNCVHLQAWRNGQTLHWHPIWTDAKTADILANGPSPTLPLDPVNVSASAVSSAATSSSVTQPFVDVAEQPDASIDHYTVFITQNGYDLLPVAEAQPGIESLNLSSLPLPPGDYTAYIKAVAKPGLLNQMSRAIAFTVAPPPATTSATADATTSATVTVTAPTAPPAPTSSSSTTVTTTVTPPPPSSSTTATSPSSDPASATTTTPPFDPTSATTTTPPSDPTSTASTPPSTTSSTSSTDPTPTATAPTVEVTVTPPAEPATTLPTSSDNSSSADSSSGTTTTGSTPAPGSADDKRESQTVRSANRLHHHDHSTN